MGSTMAPSDLGAHWSSPLSADCLGRHCASRQLSATPLPPSGPATCSGDWKLPSLIIRCRSSASLPGQPTSSAAVRSALRARPVGAGAASPGEECIGGGAMAGQVALSARPTPQACQLSSLMPCKMRNTSDAHFGPPRCTPAAHLPGASAAPRTLRRRRAAAPPVGAPAAAAAAAARARRTAALRQRGTPWGGARWRGGQARPFMSCTGCTWCCTWLCTWLCPETRM